MRVAVLAAVVFLSACAGDKLERAPPSGVDLSGQWKLNEADSDDPMHLILAANAQAAGANTGNSGGGGGRRGGTGGSGGGSGGGRGGSGAGAGLPPVPIPATPSIGVLGDALRWPGKRLEISQAGAAVVFTSEGKKRVCEAEVPKKPPRQSPSDPDGPLAAARDAPPPRCGWTNKTLIVRTGDVDDDRPPLEERYSVSEDGKRLFEVVGFKGGSSNGFSMSRVWDRVPQ